MITKKDLVFIGMSGLMSSLATCKRRKVGTILTNKLGHILSSGYNGVPIGFPHCTDKPCGGAKHSSGEGLAECLAIHAEQNALLQCSDIMKIEKCYTTTSPCPHCIKLLLNTSCKEILFVDEYSNSLEARKLWESSGRKWTKINEI